jgi:hypothetical protein
MATSVSKSQRAISATHRGREGVVLAAEGIGISGDMNPRVEAALSLGQENVSKRRSRDSFRVGRLSQSG